MTRVTLLLSISIISLKLNSVDIQNISEISNNIHQIHTIAICTPKQVCILRSRHVYHRHVEQLNLLLTTKSIYYN